MKARFIAISACLAATLVCGPAPAQVSYPVKPVRMVLPYPPGGAVDALARGLGNELAKIWAQPVVIDGKPGAGGVTAAVTVARSAPDGYTIFLADQVPLAVTPFLQRDLPYDALKDFAAVIALVQSSSVLVVPRDFPAATMQDFITAAKAKPGAINYGTWGIASTAHLNTEELATAAGIRMTHVPYKGAADVFRGLLGGEVQAAFVSIAAASPQIRQGQLKALAYGGAKRTRFLPEVPTMAEAGVPGFQVGSCLGLVVPAATPSGIISRIAADAGRALYVPEFKDKYIDGVGFEVFNLPPERYAQLLAEMRAKNEAQLKRLKLSAY